MLHVKFLPRIFELVHSTLHLLQVRVDLRPILIVDVDYLDQTPLQHKPLLLGLDAGVIQAVALFLLALAAAIAADRDSPTAAAHQLELGVLALRLRYTDWFRGHDPVLLLVSTDRDGLQPGLEL